MNNYTEIITTEHISIIWNGNTLYERGTASADNQGHYWYINRVIVQPESNRSKGIGSEMLQRLIKAVKSQNGKEIQVTPGGYNVDPEKQIKFYEKAGFKRQKNCYSLIL